MPGVRRWPHTPDFAGFRACRLGLAGPLFDRRLVRRLSFGASVIKLAAFVPLIPK